MNVSELYQLVRDGKFFSCEFVKRTDGTRRKMLARLGMPSQGGQLNYEPAEHNLLVVWDVRARGFRAIPADNILRLRHHGREVVSPLLR